MQMIKQGITQMLVPGLSRILKTLFPLTAIGSAIASPRGNQSGSELFLDEVMADERGVRHQLFVTRGCRN